MPNIHLTNSESKALASILRKLAEHDRELVVVAQRQEADVQAGVDAILAKHCPGMFKYLSLPNQPKRKK